MQQFLIIVEELVILQIICIGMYLVYHQIHQLVLQQEAH